MTGTLSGALEARKIPTFPNKLQGQFEGVIEAPDGVLKITKIHCLYKLEIPKGKRESAERALGVFEKSCPVAQTLKGCVEFEHEWEITEVEES
ncbi:OsmC family protein [Bacillus sp. Marseille-Q3570]|uniref:OsmC family protein n=1 Tax=Bacillus sp. Marseille-Q3570 TaxID=2963522 RepID=UPI0021B77E47|nr:OsmC family protein [Bacillus sp. Marseille-Q3570]